MEKSKSANRYSTEVRSRVVRMALEHGADRATQWAEQPMLHLRGRGNAAQGAIGSIAPKISCTVRMLRKASAYFAMAEPDRRSKQ